VGLAGVHFIDLRGLVCVREGFEDLHMNEITLSNLYLEPVVNACDDLLFYCDGSEVTNSCTKLCNNLVL